eukprot:gene29484-39077_t
MGDAVRFLDEKPLRALYAAHCRFGQYFLVHIFHEIVSDKKALCSKKDHKNPHPDAQAAFDALQDAYSTLTQADLRTQYDMDLSRARKGRRITIRRMRKLLKEWWVNLGGSCSLLRQEVAQLGGARNWSKQKWGSGLRVRGRSVTSGWSTCCCFLPQEIDHIAAAGPHEFSHAPEVRCLCKIIAWVVVDRMSIIDNWRLSMQQKVEKLCHNHIYNLLIISMSSEIPERVNSVFVFSSSVKEL